MCIYLKMNPCELCGKTYRQRQSLVEHRRRVHEGVKYPCDSCCKVFAHPTTRRQHVFRDHLGQGYPCPLCSKIFTAKNSVRQHLVLHSRKTITGPVTEDALPEIFAKSETIEVDLPEKSSTLDTAAEGSDLPETLQTTVVDSSGPETLVTPPTTQDPLPEYSLEHIDPLQLEEFLKSFNDPETTAFISQLLDTQPAVNPWW